MSRRAKAGQPTGTNCDGLPSCSIGFEPIIGRIRGADTGTCLCPCMKAFADMSTSDWVGYVAKK